MAAIASTVEIDLRVAGERELARLTNELNKNKKAANDDAVAHKKLKDTLKPLTAEQKKLADSAKKASDSMKRQKAVETELSNTTKKLSADQKKAAADFQRIQRSNTASSKQFVSSFRLGMLAAVAAAVVLARSIVRTSVEIDRMNAVMDASSATSAIAASNMEFVTIAADDMGLEILTASDSFAKLTAATRDTELQGQATRDMFIALSATNSKLGGSTDDLRGIIKSFTDMISKGTVQMEELKGQLGDRLPGALNIAAKAMKLSTKDLIEMISNGEVLATDLLPKLSKALNDTYNDGKFETAQANLNRLGNSWLHFKSTIINSDWVSNFATNVKHFLDILSGMEPELAANANAWDLFWFNVLGGARIVGVKTGALTSTLKEELTNQKELLKEARQDYKEYNEGLKNLKDNQDKSFFSGVNIDKIKPTPEFSIIVKNFANADAAVSRLQKLYDKSISNKKKHDNVIKELNDAAIEIEKKNLDDKLAILNDTKSKEELALSDSIKFKNIAFNNFVKSKQNQIKKIQDLATAEKRALTPGETGTISEVTSIIDVKTKINDKEILQLQLDHDKKIVASNKQKNDLIIADNLRLVQSKASQLQTKEQLEIAFATTDLGRLKAQENAEIAANRRRLDTTSVAGQERLNLVNTVMARELIIRKKFAGERLQLERNSEQAIKEFINESKEAVIAANGDPIQQLQLETDQKLEAWRLYYERIREMAIASGADLNSIEKSNTNMTKAILDEAANKRIDIDRDNRSRLQTWAEDSSTVQQDMEDIGITAAENMAEGFAEMAVNSEASFGEMAAAFLKDVAKMIIQALILKAIQTAIGFAFGGAVDGDTSAGGSTFNGTGPLQSFQNANGAAIRGDHRITKFANGGSFTNSVVRAPTKFAFGGQLGVMGERGPEGILPLKTMANGELGVNTAGGGGSGGVVIQQMNVSIIEKEDETSEEQSQRLAEAMREQLKQLIDGRIMNANRSGNINNPTQVSNAFV